jgi:glutamate N-acetyltransferase/amino-acid N-acetyltransferase
MSVTRPRGFEAAGVASGIKPGGVPDLALLVATPAGGGSGRSAARPVAAAGVFTRSKAPAAPVELCRAHLAATGGRAAAVIVNSGCANAATGASGAQVAARTARTAAAALGVRPEEVLVCSTGVIGADLPFAPIEAAMGTLVGSLGAGDTADGRAAAAILTTDTRTKQTFSDHGSFSIGGMCKGAGMVAPDMATMLAFLTTDAVVEPDELDAALRAATEKTFNRITIDGCTSTNDSVLLLASGLGGEPTSGELTEALTAACRDLALQIVADAEGGTKVVTVIVTGAGDEADALRAGRAIADSNLVKCSWFGADPNWGRILGAAAVSGAAIDPSRVRIAYGDTAVCESGTAAPFDDSAVRAYLEGHEIEVRCDLGVGSASAEVLGADLTHGYVDENTGLS